MSKAIEGTPVGTYTDDLSALDFAPTSVESLTEEAVKRYLTSIHDDQTIELGEIRDVLLDRINTAIAEENAERKQMRSTSPKIVPIQALDEYTVVRVLLARRRIVAVNLSGTRSPDDTVLAMYNDLGPEQGLYVVSESPIKELASAVRPSITGTGLKSLLERVKVHAPVVTKTTDAHLIPVANGIFDHNAQELLDFSPDHVFMTKSPVRYVSNPANPVIDTPHGDQWDVETWIQELSDDAGVPELLWEILSAIVRPGVRWNKAAFFHSSRGNNGKGTLCELMRNLVGPGGHASIPIANFGKNFALTELIRARAIIVDENSVGAFAKDLGDMKAIITGDHFTLEKKHKDPVSVSFSGMMVQCVNDFPKSRDKSASYTRRQLFVPFRKYFGGDGVERSYIKGDYLKRAEVLEYVLWRILSMRHVEFSQPAACSDLLAQFQRENNPVRDFWMEFEDEFVWDLLPTAFLYDLFLGWFRRVHPSGIPANRNDFASQLVDVLAGSDRWLFSDPQKKHRPGQKMMLPEPLIAAYDLKEWKNKAYSGDDEAKLCMPSLKTNYIGVARVTGLTVNLPVSA